MSIRIGPDSRESITVTKISYDHAVLYERVHARGARLRSMFSLSVIDSTLKALWSSAEELDYVQALPVESSEEKDRYRKRVALEKVFQHFGVVDGFDWLTGNGLDERDDDNPVRRIAVPLFDTNAEIELGEEDDGVQHPAIGEHWNRESSFDRHLLVRVDSDDPDSEFLDPLAIVFLDEAHADDGVAHYALIESADELNAYVGPLDGQLGMRVRGRPMPHVLGLAEMDTDTYGSGTPPVSDYAKMIVTVAAQTAIQPTAEAITLSHQTDRRTTLVIDVPDAETWWVVKGTAVDVSEDGTTVVGYESPGPWHDGHLIRDDTPRLRRIAAMAAAFYGIKRASVVLEFDDILSIGYSVGTMIKEIKDAGIWLPVNTVITEKQFDFRTYKTRIITSHQRIDFGGLA